MEESFNTLIAAGFMVRSARIDDLPQAVPMFNAAEAELSGSADWTVERYEQEWLTAGIHLETSTRVIFAPGGQLVGLVELWDQSNPPAHPWIWGRVHPEWQGQGIGSAMLDWALKTSLRALERLPQDARLAPTTGTPSHHTPTIQLFEGIGMQVSRYSWRMVASLDGPTPEPRWPEGLQVRTLRYPEDLEAVFRAENEAFSEHWGYIERPFEEAFPRWKNYTFEALGVKPELWFLAMDGEVIAGSINAMERSDLVADMGWIPTLAVRKPYRRRGLGQALLQQAFRALQERGVQKVGLYVDAKNKSGATRLYQRIGMHVNRENIQYEFELRPGRELAVHD
jgi:mycothiol synthase